MLTANYDFYNESGSNSSDRSSVKWRAPIAYVYGSIRGVPFRRAVKTVAALNRAFRMGYEIRRVN